MRLDYTQVFLPAWTAAFWIYSLLTYGAVEEEHERSSRMWYGAQAKWAPFFGLAFLGWTLVILVCFFHYDSIRWAWQFSFLDRVPVKIFAIVLMCLAFLLNILFGVSIGSAIRAALASGEEPKLATTGVCRFVRHPGYLAFLAAGLGCFPIIPNLITMVLVVYTCIAVYGRTLEEERKLLQMYGEAYERYRQSTGRYLPGLLRT
jgi:protein-S-isoprenylcysteine O-methyltransferase Ste14